MSAGGFVLCSRTQKGRPGATSNCQRIRTSLPTNSGSSLDTAHCTSRNSPSCCIEPPLGISSMQIHWALAHEPSNVACGHTRYRWSNGVRKRCVSCRESSTINYSRNDSPRLLWLAEYDHDQILPKRRTLFAPNPLAILASRSANLDMRQVTNAARLAVPASRSWALRL